MIVKNCTKASISNAGEQNPAPICEASVKIFKDTEDITLAIKADYFDDLYTDVIVTFYDVISGLIVCHCSLFNPEIQFIGSEQFYFVTCVINEQISTLERRRDLKVISECKLQIAIPYPDEFLIGYEHYSSYKSEHGFLKFPGQTHNISVGGIAFHTEYPLQVGEQIEIDLIISSKQVLALNAEVLRIDDSSTSSKTEKLVFHYGCKFVSLRGAKERLLRQFVFHEQLQKRNFYS